MRPLEANIVRLIRLNVLKKVRKLWNRDMRLFEAPVYALVTILLSVYMFLIIYAWAFLAYTTHPQSFLKLPWRRD